MNAHNTDRKKFQSTMPEIDEGWWDAVLAEEQQHTPLRPPVAPSKPKVVERQEKPLAPSPEVHTDWEAARKLYAEDCIIDLNVTGHNHGGLLVQANGLSGFVPFSHLVDLAGKEADRSQSLEVYTGKTIRAKMIECVPEDGRVVFSERAALTPPGKRTELFHSLRVGDQVMGRVTNLTDFGVFVDLGGVEGLIHLSELSWGRVLHPNQFVRISDEIKVQVLEISVERSRVALSLKRLIPNPWERAEAEFPVGRILPAVITSVLSYGAFARIEAGVEGLIHASEMSLDENQTPRTILVDGQQVQVCVLHVEPSHQRLGLSLKIDPA